MQMDLATTVFALVVLIISVIIHEVAHGYAAYALGDPTAKLQGRLTLNPLRHIDPMGSIIVPALLVLTHSGIMFGWAKPVPYNPHNLKNRRWGEAIVGAAGVATNLLLAVVFALLTRVALGAGMPVYAQAAATIAFVNLFLGLFNLLPIPPIDGYTILRGLLPYKYAMSLRSFENRLRSGGLFTLVAFLLLFSYVFAGPFSVFVNWVFALLVGQPA